MFFILAALPCRTLTVKEGCSFKMGLSLKTDIFDTGSDRSLST
jgi:hypothetical protein